MEKKVQKSEIQFALSIRLTQSYSLTSPGISNWTVNEGSQTTQTGGYWDRVDSFDSTKSYSFNSKHSNLERHHRSRSVPSVRCMVCRQAQTPTNMRVSESMHYTSRNVHHETGKTERHFSCSKRFFFSEGRTKTRGSLPDLRIHCSCSRRYEGHSLLHVHAESIGSAESLIEEPEECLGGSSPIYDELRPPSCHTLRRCSENDIDRRKSALFLTEFSINFFCLHLQTLHRLTVPRHFCPRHLTAWNPVTWWRWFWKLVGSLWDVFVFLAK